MRYKGASAVLSSASSGAGSGERVGILRSHQTTSSRSADMIQSRETSSISKLLHYTTQGLCTAAERKDCSACLIVNIIAVSDLELD